MTISSVVAIGPMIIYLIGGLILIKYSDKPLTELVQTIMNEVKQFSSGIPQSDDITILALHNNGI